MTERVPTRSPGCPPCVICEGEAHHWLLMVEDPDDPDREHPAYAEGVFMSCQHCEATRAITEEDEP